MNVLIIHSLRAFLVLLIYSISNSGVAQKPNIIVIFTDDQTYRAIGYNSDDVKTPHLDRLANEGIIFNKAFVASPICAASRASIMTGVFPQQHGVIALASGEFDKYKDGGARADQTLPYRLRAAGYRCAFWGKSHLGDPKTYGFSEGAEVKGYDDTETFARARTFLTEAAGDTMPFFLWLAPRQPHIPLKPAREWLDLYNEQDLAPGVNFREHPLSESINNQGVPGESYYRDSDNTNNWKDLPAGPPRDERVIRLFMKAYYATISHLDEQVGQLVSHLETLGLDKNTVIVYLSDNGYHLGSHGLGNKITMHEESVRVPMFINWAGLKLKGVASDALVSSLDVYPTLLQLTGTELPGPLMGKSLVPLLYDPQAPFREVVFSECTGVKGKPGDGHRMARTQDWKYVLTDVDEEYLFDGFSDPWELNNLRDSHDAGANAILGKLQEALANWMEEIGDRNWSRR
jgi:arylsulfatase A-like enzyme